MANDAIPPRGGALAAIAASSDHDQAVEGPSRRTLRRRRQRADAAARRNIVDRFPPDLLAEIHRYLHVRGADFLQRLAFASVCQASSSAAHLFRQETPCLLLPSPVVAESDGDRDDAKEDEEDFTKATVFSVADRRGATVRTSDPAMRGQAILGSSCGWLVTADESGTLRMANPVTGAQVALPAITTGSIPVVKRQGCYFDLDPEAFLQIRFAGAPPPDYGGPVRGRTYTFREEQMAEYFCRKVVLSAPPHGGGGGGGGYAAMLVMERDLGAPAFATSEDPEWRMAPSRDGVEDAIHHDGRFYSITYSGVVEAWDQRKNNGGAAEWTSAVVAPTLPPPSDDATLRRKYLAVGPGGQLMAVLKHAAADAEGAARFPRRVTRVWFTVQVLDEARGRWDEAVDIGDAAIFVGINASLCVPAAEHRRVVPSCVYFTDDEVPDACQRHRNRDAYRRCSYRDVDDSELRNAGVYSLMSGKVEKIGSSCLGENEIMWPVAAWFTPSVV
ncbi:hypothetical protein U9M48_030891 [Paspalum notatum var. saurae]|uniref:KIB1-4 beta-propeller domain-containing protein n=1 Tax=Paspalum notatum var. saurae TaxID=547442 RepID=A0AAQ3X2R5_PASNO